MSEYQYGHGQWPQQQQQQPPQFSQYGYPPSNNSSQYPYIPPSGQLRPSQDPQHQGYYGAAQASQAAFDHNAQAPGLGIGAGPAASRSPNAVGGGLSWSEAFGGGPAAAPPSSYNPPAPSYQQQQHHYHSSASGTPTSFQQHSYGQQQQQQYGQQQYTSQHYQQHPPPPPPPPQHQPPQQVQQPIYSAPSYPSVERGQASEEGELSDDMDDTYDPEAPSDPALYTTAQAPSSASSQNTPAQPVEAYLQPASPEMPGTALGQAAADMPSRDASVIDTQDDAFYDDDDDEPGEIKSTGNRVSASDAGDADVEDVDSSDAATNKSLAAASGEAMQDRAMSYSPRLSPGEIKDDDNTRAPGLNGVASGHLASQQMAPTAVPPSGLAYATVDEAKKKAQQAILRLIRYDVSYQTFIDEGVDDQVVTSLFTELGLKIDAPKNADGPLRTESPAVQPPPPASVPAAETVASNPPPSTTDDNASKKEERKDRIARLLALKASKAASSPASASTPVPAPVSLPAAPVAKADTKSEKARLLQQKLEALRQAQDKRTAAAAKAASDTAALSKTVPAPLSHPLPARPTMPSTASTHLPAAQPTAANAANTRKRPVATDFVDFAHAPTNAYKRPYGIARQDSTLVIDVSDDENSSYGHGNGEDEDDDDDDDVEMELESQADETVSHVTDFTGARGHGRSAGNGQAPSVAVPPTAPASMIARAKDDEYTRKMRQIEDMKRKIAEAEAKKQRGTSAGSVTPVTGGHGTSPGVSKTANGRSFDAAQIVRPVPQPMRRITSTGELAMGDGSNAASAASSSAASSSSPIRLPKRGDIRPSPSPLSSRGSLRDERARAASVQLPRVEANLQEKMFKLRLLQDKVNALQSEISAGIAEKRRLTEDLEDIASGSDAPAANVQVVDGGAARADSIAVAGDGVVVVDSPSPQQSVETVQQPVAESFSQDSESAPAAVDVDMDAAEDSAVVAASAGPVGPASESVAVAVVDAGAEAKAKAEADEYEPILIDGEQGAESAPMSVASSPPYEPADDVEMDGPAESGEDGEVIDEEEEDEEDDEDEDMMADDDGDALVIDDGEPTDVAPPPVVDEAEADVVEDVVQPLAPAAPAPAPAPSSTSAPAPAPASTYTPYDSPLQYFRSYRFHPQYKAQVAGGLKSLTYSGKIRDDVQLCPAESEGDACTNPACPFQHFSSIMPQDDQILVELGSSDEYTGEQQSRFVDGLKAVLRQVRDDNVRDFDTIADAIIAFRRTFLADETRILANLGGAAV